MTQQNSFSPNARWIWTPDATAAPGYRTFVVDPVPGDLEWARGSVVTPHGPIYANWRRSASGELQIECTAPTECRRVECTRTDSKG